MVSVREGVVSGPGAGLLCWHSAGLEARPALGRGGHAAGPTHGLHLCSMATLIMALLGQHDKYINIGNFLSLNFKNGKYL